MKSLKWIRFGLVFSLNSFFVSNGYAVMGTGDVLTHEQVDQAAVGGELREKKGDELFRVLCTEYSATNPNECISFGMVELRDQGTHYRVLYVYNYGGHDPQQLAQESLEIGKFSRRAKDRDEFGVVVDFVPTTTGAIVLAALAYQDGSKAAGIVFGTIATPVCLAFDLASAPVRLPIKLIRKAKFNKRVKRFLKSIVENDKSYTAEIRSADFSDLSSAMQIFGATH
ncbi:MAG: hypothetical protein JNL01_11190 [Bdellovibrionales bacterium]|nr:hypothetical protein [Bdellovibrionales bacterium]